MMSVLIQIGIVFFIVCETVNFISGQGYEKVVPVVGKVKYKVICQGKSGNLSCTNESMVMVIFNAHYGRKQSGEVVCAHNILYSSQDTKDSNVECKGKDVTDKVKPLCQKQTICDVPANNRLLGRPCKGVYKYLNIIYGCVLPISTTPQPVTTILPHIQMTPSPGWQNGSMPYTKAILADSNQNSYVAVFVVAALCAAVLFGIVFGRCWYLRRRTKSQNFAVLHKPKRFFDPAQDYKQSNGHLARRASRDHANEELLPDRASSKTEVVVTRADVETSQPSRTQRSEVDSSTTSRAKPGSAATSSAADEGDGSKPDNSTFYVNPMYDRNRQNSTGSTLSAGSHPRIHAAHRLSNASEGGKPSGGRPLNKQQMRCNSMGNLPRSHHSSMQRRHPSAGNVASNKDGLSFDPLTYPPKGGHHSQGNPYNTAPMQNYQGQGQGNYQGQGQGNYQGQGQGNYQGQGQGDYQGVQRQTPGTPGRGTPGAYGKSPMTQRPGISSQSMGSPAKAPQRNRPMGPGGVSYQAPGPPGRTGNRPNSPYEYGTTENAFPARTDVPQWESSAQSGDRTGMTTNPSYSTSNGPNHYPSNGPNHYPGNGRLHRRESYENIKPFDNLPDPVVHDETKLNGRVYQGHPPGGANTVGPLDSIKLKMEALFT